MSSATVFQYAGRRHRLIIASSPSQFLPTFCPVGPSEGVFLTRPDGPPDGVPSVAMWSLSWEDCHVPTAIATLRTTSGDGSCGCTRVASPRWPSTGPVPRRVPRAHGLSSTHSASSRVSSAPRLGRDSGRCRRRRRPIHAVPCGRARRPPRRWSSCWSSPRRLRSPTTGPHRGRSRRPRRRSVRRRATATRPADGRRRRGRG